YAHAQGIVHRDIKPSNILMDAEGNAFVADFGIATILGGTRHLTQTGAFLASPSYCAPEQLTGGTVGTHSDIYSVGMVLYELLTGTPPFDLDGSLVSILKRADSAVPPPRGRNSGITPAIEAVVEKALAPLPRDRFSTGREMSAALSAAIRAIDAQETTAVPVAAGSTVESAPKAARRRRPLVVWAAALVALVIGGVLARPALQHSE